MNRKSQITLFIIVGVILIIIAGITFSLITKQVPAGQKENQMITINNYVTSCLKSTLAEGLSELGRTGGRYVYVPSSDVLENVPYFYKNQTVQVTETQRFEQELSNYITLNINSCLANMTSFDETIQVGNITATTQINNEDVQAELHMPVTVKGDDYLATEENYLAQVKNVRIPLILEASRMVAEDIKSGNGYICMSCINDFANESKTGITINQIENDTIIVEVTDLKSQSENVQEKPYSLIFLSETK